MSIIEISKMHKSYGDNVLFDNFNLLINNGDFISIMGKSGSGKSTLLNIIGMLDVMDKGDLTILGNKNPRINTTTGRNLLRNNISYLFQNFALVDEWTVLDNLRVGTHFLQYTKKQEMAQIESVLEKIGLESCLQKKVYQLSGGEQQRVAIARVMLKPADIILADEPTGSVDSINRDIIMEILSNLNKSGKTIVMVTHDSEVAKCAGRLIKI